MKAMQFDTYGGAEVMHLVDTTKPVPGTGQIRIKVKATAVNPSDWKRRKGLYQEFETATFSGRRGGRSRRYRRRGRPRCGERGSWRCRLRLWQQHGG